MGARACVVLKRHPIDELTFLSCYSVFRAHAQVHETAQDMIPDEKDNINGVPQLSLEATTINQNFSQQVLVPNGATEAPFVSV